MKDTDCADTFLFCPSGEFCHVDKLVWWREREGHMMLDISIKLQHREGLLPIDCNVASPSSRFYFSNLLIVWRPKKKIIFDPLLVFIFYNFILSACNAPIGVTMLC